MARKLKAPADLKKYFAEYETFQAKLKELHTLTTEINRYNKTSAGHDDIGKQYHDQVDKPTENLTDTVQYVANVLGMVKDGGDATVEQLDDADQDAEKTAQSW
ncbi:hypothetical protein [Streptomyces sp.]|uniref:hypothetical protein n=1 Tax=Streptomyces sp. TaxID=1931 RepID=UPI002F3F5E9B